MTRKDELMDVAQEALVGGATHDQVVAKLIASGATPTDAEDVTTTTERHPITKILITQRG